ncbi:MAG: S8 family peptidase [Lachnospiraceae bacterium]|nr:S8 family peptidase [Lachnospiraceae bacterium]
MENEKIEDQLNLALQIPQQQLLGSAELSAGYNKDQGTWELVVRFAGAADDFAVLSERYEADISILSGNYAIVTIRENRIGPFSRETSVIYIEKAKNISPFVQAGIRASCPLSVRNSIHTTGEGVLIGIIDSGIDVLHPDFIRSDGKSAFVEIWDQTTGRYFDEEEIQESISERKTFITDLTGHGTHVASIAAGNQGVAPQAQIMFVKLGRSVEGELSRTTNLMRAIDFLIEKAEQRQKPLAINISYGTNYGDHLGNSLLETYIDQASNLWKTCICVGTGNEGDTGRHKQGSLKNGQTEVIEISVAPYETSWNLQIWKEYPDQFSIEIKSPSGREQRIDGQTGFAQAKFGQTDLSFFWGMPSPYNLRQEIFLLFFSQEQIESGIWTIFLIPGKIKNGRYAMWLPVSETTSRSTRFLMPSTDMTLTIPSTADSVISVGAYDADHQTYAPFSGRGDAAFAILKPDLAAPGVGISAASPAGGESIRSGTSMAVPFVTGTAALLMEWGIVQGHDPYLYGEKVKAYLQRGAKLLPGFKEYPNNQIGYGEDVIIRLH